jgi:hypothetical protein
MKFFNRPCYSWLLGFAVLAGSLSACKKDDLEGQTPNIQFKTKDGYCGEDPKEKILGNPNVTGFHCLDPASVDYGYRPMDAFIEDLSDEISKSMLATGDNLRLILFAICPNGKCPNPNSSPTSIPTSEPSSEPTSGPTGGPGEPPPPVPPVVEVWPPENITDIIDDTLYPPLPPPRVPPLSDGTASSAAAKSAIKNSAKSKK